MKQTCKYSTRKTLFLLKRKIFMSINFWPKSWCQCVFHFMQHQTKRSLCCSQTTPQQKSNKRKCQYLLVFRLKRIKVELPCSYHISYSKSLPHSVFNIYRFGRLLLSKYIFVSLQCFRKTIEKQNARDVIKESELYDICTKENQLISN